MQAAHEDAVMRVSEERRKLAAGLMLLSASALSSAQSWAPAMPAATPDGAAELALPPPSLQGRLSLEAALSQRRSLRSFATEPLTVGEVGQLLWAAQGVSGALGQRTAPSAGATYPLVLYLVAGHVEGVPRGVHRYLPHGHRLVALAHTDVRGAVARAAHGQSWIGGAPAMVVIAAQPARTVARYGAHADRYVAIEAGAAAQNLMLQAVALGLGSTLVGAFDEAALHRSMLLAADERPQAIVPLGRHREGPGKDRP
jgi:SagB-type dehydrogenase family enzyme